MKITDHKLSEGIALTFRVPEGNIKHPLIILCHGFCGIRNVLLPCFANAFTEAGFATITFDYRGFGESDGERGRLVPAMQTEDIISVINWAEKQECIDNQRIGLWGTSLGGGHVFSAAAQDQRVKCIVSQLAFADGDVLVTGEMNESERASFLSTLNKMAEKKKNTGKEMFVGVTRVLSDNESKVFFEKVKGQYPEMDIKIPGTVAKLAMRQPFVLFKGLTFQKLCLPGAFRPGDHHNKMLRPGLCVVHASPQYL